MTTDVNDLGIISFLTRLGVEDVYILIDDGGT